MTDFYDRIARYYDAENAEFTDDLPLYETLAGQYGTPVLDVGCGSGRVCFHLAQTGCKTVGIDTSAEMLDAARQKLGQLPHLREYVQLVQADILNFQAGTYPLILLPYNALMHFTGSDTQIRLMRHLRDMLDSDGVIVIDLPNAGEAYAAEDAVGIVLERTFTLPENGNLVMQQSVSTIDRANQLLYVDWIYDEVDSNGGVQRTLAPLTLRYVFPGEMHLLMKLCGLEVLGSYGDYDQSPFEDGCPRMIVLARKSV